MCEEAAEGCDDQAITLLGTDRAGQCCKNAYQDESTKHHISTSFAGYVDEVHSTYIAQQYRSSSAGAFERRASLFRHCSSIKGRVHASVSLRAPTTYAKNRSLHRTSSVPRIALSRRSRLERAGREGLAAGDEHESGKRQDISVGHVRI